MKKQCTACAARRAVLLTLSRKSTAPILRVIRKSLNRKASK